MGRDELGLLSDAQARIPIKTPVRSIGLVSDSVLAAIYQEAHCLVNTSLDEGFCLPILEAQSRGVPIVCSDIPVLREIASDGAMFFNPVDLAELAKNFSIIFADEPLRESHGKSRARKCGALFMEARG